MNTAKRRWLQSAILAAGAEKIDILPWIAPYPDAALVPIAAH